MIGYIKPFKPEMKYREMALYNAYYCSVCKAVCSLGGRVFCVGLSHDLTSVALLHASMCTESEKIERVNCQWNPLKKVNVLKNYQNFIHQAAEMNVLLCYYKASDDSHDSRNPWTLMLQGMLFPGYRKARERNSALDIIINDRLKRYQANESVQAMSLEQKLDPYALLIGGMVSRDAGDPYVRKCLYWFGYHLAKLTCIFDALDDYHHDYFHNNFNLLQQGKRDKREQKKTQEEVDCEKAKITAQIDGMICYSIQQVRSSLLSLPLLHNQAILENIFIENTRQIYARVIKTERSDTNETT